MGTFIRLSVNMNLETAAALRTIATNKGASFTEMVRRCISVYKYLEDERLRGNKLYLVDENSNERREIILL